MRFRAVPHHPCHTEHREGAHVYGQAILEAKHSHWTNYLEEASDSDLWNINCYLKALRQNIHPLTQNKRGEWYSTRDHG